MDQVFSICKFSMKDTRYGSQSWIITYSKQLLLLLKNLYNKKKDDNK